MPMLNLAIYDRRHGLETLRPYLKPSFGGRRVGDTLIMVRYRSCSVMRCEDKFSSRHRFSDAANNLNLFQKVGVNEALINIPTEQIFHKPSSTLTTGNVGVNIVKMLGINKWILINGEGQIDI
ncbi:hypothetical protein NQ317_013227 [Molorchus minor]|uniref:Uncharacterized protein n=1 Tax=Molorchus minor TaxID=1323400 RepID=A0ABQ9JR98_9CUCU|nr:hypothetical protein NQ317_013227 [Molorchus minor]